MRIVFGLLCLCFLIFFHELGHFIAAKIFGVSVESFSIGFGPILFHKKIKGTDYRISLIPLGGYCGLKGEKDFANAIELGLDKVEGEPDSMYGIHPLKRAIIAFAGPFFNVILAVISFSFISFMGYTYNSYSSKINLATDVYPEMTSSAKDAGLVSGDIITKVNEKTISNFSDLLFEISTKPNETVKITVDRAGQTFTFDVPVLADKDSGMGKIGVIADSSTLSEYEAERFSFFPAIANGIKETGKSIVLTIKGIFSLFKSSDIKNSVSGPASIIDIMGSAAKDGFSVNIRTGFANILNLMAFISISLFIMNLLPIPILDGGLILFAFCEIILRKKIHPKVMYYVQFVGIAFIMIFFVLGVMGDISYFKNMK